MVKIKRIVTAIGNSKLNEELKDENLEVVCGDILYKEGILEFLEDNKNVDYIIINENLSGNIKLIDLLEKIKKKNNKIRIILISKNNNEINKEIYKNVYRKIESANKNSILNIILKKDSIYSKPTIPINDFFNLQTKDGEIISILGPNGVGKSIFSITLANNIKDKKILIMDFDAFNDSIYNLLGIKKEKISVNERNNIIFQKNINKIENNSKKLNNFNKFYNVENKSKIYEKNKINNEKFLKIKDFIIKTKYNIDLLSGINIIFNLNYQIGPNELINILNNLKREYDYIIIDLSSDYLIEYTIEILKKSENIIFISGSNLLEIKKAQKLLNIYIEEFNIPKEKINIIFNKWSKNSIDDGVLRELFRNYKILGKIKLSDYYDLAINRNDIKNKQIEKNIKYIRRKIVRKK